MDKSLNIKVSATDEASSVMAKAEAAVHKLNYASAATSGGSGGGFGGLDSLKGAFGRGSTFFEFGHLLEAGGPVRGIKLASDLIQEATKHFAELNEQFREGKINASEFTEHILAGVPIFGQFWQAGRAIHDLFSKEAQDAKRITEEAEATNAVVEVQRKLVEDIEASHERSLKVIEEIQHHIETIGLKGPELSLANLGFSTQGAVGGAEDKFKEDQKKLVADSAKELDHQYTRLQQARFQLSQAQQELERVTGAVLADSHGQYPPHGSTAIDNATKPVKEAQEAVDVIESKIARTKAIRDKGVIGAAADRDQTILKAQEEFELKSADIQDQAAADAARKSHEQEQQILDFQAEAYASRLRAVGDSLDAEIELKRRTADREVDEIQQKGEREKTAVEDIERAKQAVRERFRDEESALTAESDRRLQDHNAHIFDEFARFRTREARKAQQDRGAREPVRFAPFEETGGTGAGSRLRSQSDVQGQEDKQTGLLEQLLRLWQTTNNPMVKAIEDLGRQISTGAASAFGVFSGR